MGGHPQGGTLSASRAESAAMGRIQRVLEHGGDSDLHARDPQEEPSRSVGRSLLALCHVAGSCELEEIVFICCC